MMETKRKTAVAATTTVKNLRENDSTHYSRFDYSTHKFRYSLLHFFFECAIIEA